MANISKNILKTKTIKYLYIKYKLILWKEKSGKKKKIF